MSEPCRRCGATKTDPVCDSCSIRYELAAMFGYELRQCGRCRHLRLLNRRAFARRHHVHSDGDPAHEYQFNHAVHAPSHEEAHATIVETGPPDNDEPPPPALIVDPDHRETYAKLVPGENREIPFCPRCGSRAYRRSRRRWFEHLLRRPPMARCRSCRQRFPYPRHGD